MTLGGLVKHMALVEADWLVVKLAGQPYGPPWDEVDFDADPDWEWRTGAQDAPGGGVCAVAVGGAAVPGCGGRRAAWQGGHGRCGPVHPRGTGVAASVREMLLDMIEEYARHTGHADLVRESVDGLVGEGAPADFRL